MLLIPDLDQVSIKGSNTEKRFFAYLSIYLFIALFSTSLFCEKPTVKQQLKQLKRNLTIHYIFALGKEFRILHYAETHFLQIEISKL